MDKAVSLLSNRERFFRKLNHDAIEGFRATQSRSEAIVALVFLLLGVVLLIVSYQTNQPPPHALLGKASVSLAKSPCLCQPGKGPRHIGFVFTTGPASDGILDRVDYVWDNAQVPSELLSLATGARVDVEYSPRTVIGGKVSSEIWSVSAEGRVFVSYADTSRGLSLWRKREVTLSLIPLFIGLAMAVSWFLRFGRVR